MRLERHARSFAFPCMPSQFGRPRPYCGFDAGALHGVLVGCSTTAVIKPTSAAMHALSPPVARSIASPTISASRPASCIWAALRRLWEMVLISRPGRRPRGLPDLPAWNCVAVDAIAFSGRKGVLPRASPDYRHDFLSRRFLTCKGRDGTC